MIFTKILKDALTNDSDTYEVLIAHDGEEGMEMAQKELPQLIVLDIKMPKLGGMDFLRQFKSLHIQPQIPVLISTHLL